MASTSTNAPLAHASLLGLAQQVLHRIAEAKAGRQARREDKAAAAALLQMDPRLLDDIGADSWETAKEDSSLSRLNPLVVAVNLYTIPRNGR